MARRLPRRRGRLVSDPKPECSLVSEDGGGTCPAGLPVPRGTVTTRATLRSVAVLVLLAVLLTAASLVFTAHYVSTDDRKWCAAMTLLTAKPVPKPADPKANPSRQQNWLFYETFLTLRRNLGC